MGTNWPSLFKYRVYFVISGVQKATDCFPMVTENIEEFQDFQIHALSESKTLFNSIKLCSRIEASYNRHFSKQLEMTLIPRQISWH